MMDYSRGEAEPAGPVDGNPHYDPANGGVFGPSSTESEALLALTFEQRTANLIANMALLVQLAVAGVALDEDAKALGRTIQTRMGLPDGE